MVRVFHATFNNISAISLRPFNWRRQPEYLWNATDLKSLTKTVSLYICNQWLSPLTLWVRILLKRGVLDTTLSDTVFVSDFRSVAFHRYSGCLLQINGRNDIAEILLKVAWNTLTILSDVSLNQTCYSIFSFIRMFCGSLFVLLSFFFLAIVFSVLLRYTDSDYPFGIFKLFLHGLWPVEIVIMHHLSSEGPPWLWLYGSWIYNYICNQWLSPLTLWVRIPLKRGVLDTTLSDTVFVSDFRSVAFVLWIVVCPFVLFLFGHCVFCPSSIYGFWLPLWYLQTLLTI
jgi:hypothetical protein